MLWTSYMGRAERWRQRWSGVLSCMLWTSCKGRGQRARRQRLRKPVSRKSSFTILLQLLRGVHGYGHRDNSLWKGIRVWGIEEVLMRAAGMVGVAEVVVATGTIRWACQ